MKKVGIYVRCSTNESRQDIENQLQCQIEWCKSKGYECEIYKDFISGYKKPEGPEFKQLKKDVQTGKIQLVSFYKLDRLTRRGISHGFNLIQFFKSHSVKVRSHTEAFLDPELAPEIQDLVFSVMLWAAQLESSKTSDRIKTTYKRKKAEAKENGKEIVWGRKKNSFKFNIDILELKKFFKENPSVGYGAIAKHFTYFDKKTRSHKVPSRSGIKERLARLGVQKILSKNSNGKKVSKWVFEKSTD